MCDIDHGLCRKCRKSGYKLRKPCRAAKKADKICHAKFCVALEVEEKNWICGRCLNARQTRDANELLEKKQRLLRREKMEKVRKAMEIRKEEMERHGKAIETRKDAADVRTFVEIRKAMEIMRLVNEESQESRGDSDHPGGGGISENN